MSKHAEKAASDILEEINDHLCGKCQYSVPYVETKTIIAMIIEDAIRKEKNEPKNSG